MEAARRAIGIHALEPNQERQTTMSESGKLGGGMLLTHHNIPNAVKIVKGRRG